MRDKRIHDAAIGIERAKPMRMKGSGRTIDEAKRTNKPGAITLAQTHWYEVAGPSLISSKTARSNCQRQR